MSAVRYRRFVASLGVAFVAGCRGGSGAGTAPPPPPSVPPQYVPTGKAAAGDTFVHLFEWRWADIARECEVWLGPKGFKGVQVSPPSEHALIASAAGSGVAYPWWQRYQTVSYRLDRSRSGTATEFKGMIDRCRAVGVDIYADAVINHMTAGSGTGFAGSAYTKYRYPDVPYGAADFHPACSIGSYQDQFQVQNCELVGLADLKTEGDAVRTRIADYLIALHALGVAGMRIDAAKHIPAYDLDQILKKVDDAAVAAGRPRPYVFLEVIDNGGEAVTADQYYGVGFSSGGASDITEFQYGYRVSDAFLGRNGATLDSALRDLSAALLPSDKAVVFVDNHDNQRGDDNLYYASTFGGQPAYALAAIYTLAQPHGVASLISSYGFDRSSQAGRDAGPPSDAGGVTRSTFDSNGNTLCTATLGSAQLGAWVCEHRVPAIANMVAFRKAAAGSPLSNCGRVSWLINADPNRLAFCRDGAGFVALSRSAVGGTDVLPTRLPPGTYCNVAAGDYTPAAGGSAASCTGPAVVVGPAPAGNAAIVLAPMGAVALHVGARL